MANSSFYLGRMQAFNTEIGDKSAEKAKYEKVLPMLEQLGTNLPDIKEDLVNAETNFKNGGFLSEGETYDKGKLKECYDDLQDDIDSLGTIISNLQTKITTLNTEIAGLESSYLSAKRNYDLALASESQTKTQSN